MGWKFCDECVSWEGVQTIKKILELLLNHAALIALFLVFRFIIVFSGQHFVASLHAQQHRQQHRDVFSHHHQQNQHIQFSPRSSQPVQEQHHNLHLHHQQYHQHQQQQRHHHHQKHNQQQQRFQHQARHQARHQAQAQHHNNNRPGYGSASEE